MKEWTLRTWTRVPLVAVLAAVVGAWACGDDTSDSPTSPSPTTLTAPALDAPAANETVSTLRPTLTVRNASTSLTGPRTYDYQVSTSNSFGTTAMARYYVAEGTGGKTSYTCNVDLSPETTYYWRARVGQDSQVSDWSAPLQFRTKQGGYNRPGELFDPLFPGNTVGEPVGSTTFIPDKGLRIDNVNSFVRYLLPQTMTTGVFSMEVEGLYVNGPEAKMKIFSMMEGLGALTNNRYELSAMYRGLGGNPDNCISFKAVWGNLSAKLEPDAGTRAAGTRSLNPSTTYYWEGSWNPNQFRLVVREGGQGGGVIYDLTVSAPGGSGPYSPDPHYVFLGANSGAAGTGDTGSWPGAIYRNVWLSDRPRPASMGNASR